MENKPTCNLNSSINPLHSDSLAEEISPNIFKRIIERNFRGISADLARIEILKEKNRFFQLKTEEDSYPIWIDDVFIELTN